MRWEICGRGVAIEPPLQDHIERRLGSATRRFGSRLDRLRITLEDVNGPRGGRDIRCTIVAWLRPTGRIVLNVLEINPFLAISRTADRLGDQIQDRLSRAWTRRRRSRRWDRIATDSPSLDPAESSPSTVSSIEHPEVSHRAMPPRRVCHGRPRR